MSSDASLAEVVRCICGKRSWPSRSEADAIVRRALVSRVLHGNARRAEQRSYECERSPGAWHVTSRKDGFVRTAPDGSLILDFADHDDSAAMVVIIDVLLAGNDHHWLDLLAPGRAEQTQRVLHAIKVEFDVQDEERKVVRAEAEHRYHVKEIDHWELYRVKQEHLQWKQRIKQINGQLLQRSVQADQAVARLRQEAKDRRVAASAQIAERAAEKRNERLETLAERRKRDARRHGKVVRQLTEAIAAHRAATSDPTPADEALWRRLEQLSIPRGDEEVTLASLLADGTWHGAALQGDD